MEGTNKSQKLEGNAKMKKEELDILQNEFVFGRLSGSAGNITAVTSEGRARPNTRIQRGSRHIIRLRPVESQLGKA